MFLLLLLRFLIVEVKVVNKSNYPLPVYKTQDSAGLDLHAHIPASIELDSLERQLIPTGLFIALPQGAEAQIRPRSGLALKRGVTVLNTPGTIDADYRGEIKILLVNLSKEKVSIEPGERIAQMVVARYEKINWEETTQLAETARGTGGYGHTGTK